MSIASISAVRLKATSATLVPVVKVAVSERLTVSDAVLYVIVSERITIKC